MVSSRKVTNCQKSF